MQSFSQFFQLLKQSKISAGVPLTYYHAGTQITSIECLTTNFLETPFTVNMEYTYRANGFLPNMTLEEIFKNKYTNLSGEKLQVRAMKEEDIYNITNLTELSYKRNFRSRRLQ